MLILLDNSSFSFDLYRQLSFTTNVLKLLLPYKPPFKFYNYSQMCSAIGNSLSKLAVDMDILNALGGLWFLYKLKKQ